MIESNTSTPADHTRISARRLLLLASVAILGIAAVVGGPFAYQQRNPLSAISPSNAAAFYPPQSAAQPAGFADLVATVKPAVISVRVKIDEVANMTSTRQSDENPQIQPGSGSSETQHREVITGLGSGFFISGDGYAVTNDHVVDRAELVEATTDDGKSYPAKVIGTDPKTDLALIKVDGTNFPHVSFAEDEPRVGDWVLAIGNPFGLGGTVTAGIVSAQGRDIGAGPYDDYIQIDAAINKGNSGGPAFDLKGKVIGINSAIYSPSGGSVGIGFDIPAITAKAVIAELKEKGYVTRGWIGVGIQSVTPEIADSLGMDKAEGVIVDKPQPESPAAKAGIESGDIITAIDGINIKGSRQLTQRIGASAPGTAVTLNLLRNGKDKTLILTLGTMPNERQPQSDEQQAPAKDGYNLGLTLAPASSVAGAGDPGVAVVAVDPSGSAAQEGIHPGDVILDVGGKAVSSPENVGKEFLELRRAGKHHVLMRIKSGEVTRFVALPLDHAPA